MIGFSLSIGSQRQSVEGAVPVRRQRLLQDILSGADDSNRERGRSFQVKSLIRPRVRRGTARMYGCIVWSWREPNNPTSSGNTTCRCVRAATKGLAPDRNAFCACQAAWPSEPSSSWALCKCFQPSPKPQKNTKSGH